MHAEVQSLTFLPAIFHIFPLNREGKIAFYYQDQFVEFGGILHDSEKVLDIQPGSVVSINTNKKSYEAKSVVITVGKTLLCTKCSFMCRSKQSDLNHLCKSP